MALALATVTTFVVASCVYNLGVGIAYAGFTAVTLDAIGRGGATKYSMLASISNFRSGGSACCSGWVADEQGAAAAMLHTEALLGVLGVAIFCVGGGAVAGEG